MIQVSSEIGTPSMATKSMRRNRSTSCVRIGRGLCLPSPLAQQESNTSLWEMSFACCFCFVCLHMQGNRIINQIHTITRREILPSSTRQRSERAKLAGATETRRVSGRASSLVPTQRLSSERGELLVLRCSIHLLFIFVRLNKFGVRCVLTLAIGVKHSLVE